MIDPEISEEAPDVTGRTLRQFAALSLTVFGGLACWQVFVRHHVWPAAILATIAISLGSVGLARPERIRPIYTALMVLTYPIGRVVSLVLLGILFYGVFTPLGLFFRLFGRDALQVRRPDRLSHWTEKPAVTDIRGYMRQS
jgi:hypothetical protein